ncbi:LLM class flavin-dependent oxidoreductase [Streptomyces sp. NBC_00009]|uniref:LLM class flavin-dependent oxidoreductase n=1 Tax=Streptomyces sp. NBC_00009 TaxID=2975620 RepID=UPI00324E61BC
MTNPAPGPALSLLDLAPIRRGHSIGDALHRTVELAAHAENLGFHRYWLAEHHNMAAMASSANIILAGAVAAGTETIRVGTGSLNLSNYAPLVVAEQIGTPDALHPGRFDLGLGLAPGTDPWTRPPPSAAGARPTRTSLPNSRTSGYNLVGRPPVVAVSDSIARVLVRRESLDDMSRRDVGL